MRLFLALLLLFLPVTAPYTAWAGTVLNIQEVQGPSGVTAWLVEDHSAPVISLSLAFRGGMALETPDKAGLARMVSILLDEGAGDLDSTAFQKQLNDHSIELKFTAGRDAFYGQMRSLSQYRDKAFELLNLALTRPRFDDEAVTRMKNANLARIKRDMGNPNWLASRSFNGTVFEGHPYAQPGFGTVTSIPAITTDNLRGFVRDQFALDTLEIAVVGNITPADLTEALQTILNGVPEKAAPYEILDAQWQYPGETILLPYDVPQTIISAGHPALPRNHPDWHIAQIVNYTLGGGGFGSRLMEELREQRGLTYGIYTSLSTMDHANIWQVSMSTKNQSAGEALNLIKAEWQKMAEAGPTEEELKNAKAYMIGALALQLTSTNKIARLLSTLQVENLGIDYLDRRKAEIEAITLEDARRVATELLRPENLTTILVGQPQGVTQTRTLGQAPGL